MPQKYHLAQVNIAKMLAPIDSPVMADFVAKLDEINALAESSKGFVWRLKGEDNNATAIKVFEDEMLIINMSVWESVEDLKDFVCKTGHSPVMRRRVEWFEKPQTAHLALWWIPAEHTPTPAEAQEKLEFLNKNGESALVFTFKNVYLPLA
jgi:Domain of unknown function (DUF3291)